MFRTEIHVEPAEEKITLSTPLLSIGSCFSDCIGKRFADFKFDILANPYGTVYNPTSIGKLLKYAITSSTPAQSTFVETQGLHANYDFHSSFSQPDCSSLTSRILESIETTRQHLMKTKWLIITLGTAFVYKHKESNEIVANCHKVPSDRFIKSLLSVDEVLSAFRDLLPILSKVNDQIKIILTVSPVRHIKDTLEQNSVSKSILRLAADHLVKAYDQVQYFPSYEIMMDDLRDYRFYKSDMLHPTEDAENYIWEKFGDRYFDDATRSFLQEWTKIRRAINHKPFNVASEGHQSFVKKTLDKLRQFEHIIDISDEQRRLTIQLNGH